MSECAQKVAIVVSEKEEISYCQDDLFSETEKNWHQARIPHLEPDLWLGSTQATTKGF